MEVGKMKFERQKGLKLGFLRVRGSWRTPWILEMDFHAFEAHGEHHEFMVNAIDLSEAFLVIFGVFIYFWS